MRMLDRSLKNMDTLSTAESTSTYTYLRDIQHYPPHKTLFIGNSVKKSLFFNDNSIKKAMRQEHRFSDKDIIFISVARLAPVKNLQGLLAAFSKIVSICLNAKLVLVGDGPEKELLKKQIKEQNLTQQVRIVGEKMLIQNKIM